MGSGLALCAALSWGAGDFLGGLASRRLAVLTVLAVSEAIGLAGVLLWVAAADDPFPGFGEFAPAAAAGIAGVIGLGALYRGMAVGAMGIVAPISAASPIVPLAVDAAHGSVPGLVQWLGVALVLGGIVALAREPSPLAGQRIAAGAGLALVAALCFGLFIVGIDAGSDVSAPWSVVSARGASVILVVAVALVTSRSLRPTRSACRCSGIGCSIRARTCSSPSQLQGSRGDRRRAHALSSRDDRPRTVARAPRRRQTRRRRVATGACRRSCVNRSEEDRVSAQGMRDERTRQPYQGDLTADRCADDPRDAQVRRSDRTCRSRRCRRRGIGGQVGPVPPQRSSQPEARSPVPLPAWCVSEARSSRSGVGSVWARCRPVRGRGLARDRQRDVREDRRDRVRGRSSVSSLGSRLPPNLVLPWTLAPSGRWSRQQSQGSSRRG
jgi:drug/metabolite transporter (DMT)-like permease